MAIELERLAQRVDDLGGEEGRILAIVDPALEDRELVTAEPRDDGIFGGKPAESRGRLLEDLVADRMTEGVVHFLEAVEIDGVQRKARFRARGLQSGAQPI